MRVYNVRLSTLEVAIICVAGGTCIGIAIGVMAALFGDGGLSPAIGPLGGLWALYWAYKIEPHPEPAREEGE